MAYIVETQGGLDGFWRFAAAVRDTPGTGIEFYDKALQKAFGMTYAEFDAGWRQWLQENY